MKPKQHVRSFLHITENFGVSYYFPSCKFLVLIEISQNDLGGYIQIEMQQRC